MPWGLAVEAISFATLAETNIASENRVSRKETWIPTTIFQGLS